jgi:hypothetical protein
MKAAVAALVLSALCAAAHGQVTISEVHFGSTEYDTDYVELFNRGNTAVDVSGWSIKHACGTCANWGVLELSGVIPAHSYYLIGVGLGNGSRTLPQPQVSGFMGVAPEGGKLILSNNQTPMIAQCPSLDSTVDMVLFGTINCESYPAAPAMNGTQSILRGNGGCTDTNNDTADFSLGLPTPHSVTNTHSCTTGPDCNGNGVDDNVELQNPANDCNTNGQLDACEIVSNPSLDCDQNGIIDCTDLKTGVLTDVNSNGTPDGCEGAVVVPATVAVTVLSTGVAASSAFARVQGTAVEDVDGRPAPAYAALRWTNSSIAQAMSAAFPNGYSLEGVYLHFKKAPDPVNGGGMVQMSHSNNDTIDLTPGTSTARFSTMNADHPPATFVPFTYTQVPGQSEARLLYSPAGPFTNGGGRIQQEIESSAATVTMILSPQSSGVAAPIAGDAHPSLEGPSLVIFADAVVACGNSDFNGDGDFGTDQDIEAFFACLAGNCCATCWPGGSDFNGDGDFGTDQDIESFFRVLGGGPC